MRPPRMHHSEALTVAAKAAWISWPSSQLVYQPAHQPECLEEYRRIVDLSDLLDWWRRAAASLAAALVVVLGVFAVWVRFADYLKPFLVGAFGYLFGRQQQQRREAAELQALRTRTLSRSTHRSDASRSGVHQGQQGLCEVPRLRDVSCPDVFGLD